MSENSNTKILKEEDSSKEQSTKNFESQKLIHPYSKYQISLTDKTLQAQSVRNLKAYVWKFTGNMMKLKDDGLRRLALSTKNPNKRMRKLDLLCSMTFIGNPGVSKVLSRCKRLRFLKDISFNFNMCLKIADSTLFSISQYLKIAYHIRNLILYFSNCTFITDKGLSSLGKNLKNMTSLKNITLYFSSCDRITDKGLNKLSKGIQRLYSLQKIELNFECCSGITNEGIISLSKSIKGLTSLKIIHLNFLRCQEISDVGLSCLCESFRGLELISVKLHFYYCQKISDVGLESLSMVLQGIGSLQNIVFNFDQCKNVSQEAVEKVKQDLKNTLPNVKINGRK